MAISSSLTFKVVDILVNAAGDTIEVMVFHIEVEVDETPMFKESMNS